MEYPIKGNTLYIEESAFCRLPKGRLFQTKSISCGYRKGKAQLIVRNEKTIQKIRKITKWVLTESF